MKITINTIVALFFVIIGSSQAYGMESEAAKKTFLGRCLYPLLSTETSKVDQKKYLDSALEYGVKNDQFCNHNLYSQQADLIVLNTLEPTHTVSIVENISAVGNHQTTLIHDLKLLKNRVGKNGLLTIHDALTKQYNISQEDAFADFEKPLMAVFFNEIDNKTNKEQLSAIIAERKLILSSKTQPSALKKLQHCITKDESVYKTLLPNNASNKNTPYFIAAGISISVLLLFFVAHKLNLLPTELPASFKNILSNNQLGHIVP